MARSGNQISEPTTSMQTATFGWLFAALDGRYRAMSGLGSRGLLNDIADLAQGAGHWVGFAPYQTNRAWGRWFFKPGDANGRGTGFDLNCHIGDLGDANARPNHLYQR